MFIFANGNVEAQVMDSTMMANEKYEREINAAWEEYETEEYYREKRKFSSCFYDSWFYHIDPNGEKKDWEDHRAFLEAEKYCSPSAEEEKARYEFMVGESEELPDIDETAFAKEYRRRKGSVNAKRRYARRYKAYERNGGLTANYSKHIRRVLNNIYLGYSGFWPGDVFHPTTRSRISTSRRRADKAAIREGIQEMHFEMQRLGGDVA